MLKDGFMEFLYGNICAADSACRPLYILFTGSLPLASLKKTLNVLFERATLEYNLIYSFDLMMFTLDKGKLVGQFYVDIITCETDKEEVYVKIERCYEEYLVLFMEEHEANLDNCKMQITLLPHAVKRSDS